MTKKEILELKPGDCFFDSSFTYLGTVIKINKASLSWTWQRLPDNSPYRVSSPIEELSENNEWTKATPLIKALA